MIPLKEAKQIILPNHHWQEIVEHGRRKLAGEYLEGESKIKRAYGLVAGVENGDILKVTLIVPIKRNVRDQGPYKSFMDEVMETYAVPSVTPFSERGWVMDPKELKACYDRCDQEDFLVFGTYHMHIVPWEHDPVRDTPTRLDTVLAEKSNLFTFIVSMVDLERPVIRAFYEAVIEKEVPISIIDF